ncbi:MAG: response regulator [Candidatus Eremiobacteraeota bacterium]|nr:response regulator [Candidatus Eremiobacteraeota bacterium]
MQYTQAELSELEGIFRAECDEHLGALSPLLVTLDKEPDCGPALNETFRRVHSVKGAARMVGYQGIEAVAHAMESMLATIRDGTRRLSASDVSTLFAGSDAIAELMTAASGRNADEPEVVRYLARIVASGKAAEAQPPQAVAAPQVVAAPAVFVRQLSERPAAAELEAGGPSADSVRVSRDKIDRLMALRGELLRLVGEDETALENLGQLDSLPIEGLDKLSVVDTQIGPLLKPVLVALRRRRRLVATCVASLVETNIKRATALDSLRDGLAELRMMPARNMLRTMPRIVRDVALAQGKKAEMTVAGADASIDKAVLDALRDPLMHLVRNAVAHGIELPAVRAARGKPPTGRVTVKLQTGSASATIEVGDDGEGIDLKAVGQAAVTSGYMTAEELASTSDAKLLQIVFRPGFSTAVDADAISGRGVGLDVVSECVAKLRGQTTVESQPGTGTRFILRVPISLLTSSVLAVRAGQVSACIQQTAIREAVMLDGALVGLVNGRLCATVNHEVVPIVMLAALAGGRAQLDLGTLGKAPALVIESRGRRALLIVDELAGMSDVIVKPLPPPLGALAAIVGYAITRSGLPMCVLDAGHIVQSAHEPSLAASLVRHEDKAKRSLLIVDDSLTTRTLLRNIMQSAGYEVATAIDGVDGWKKVQERGFDCIMSDIEMPNMSGWEFCEKVKRDGRYTRTPVVLITSLAKDAERRRGLELGASAYIVKGLFNETALLETVAGLVA